MASESHPGLRDVSQLARPFDWRMTGEEEAETVEGSRHAVAGRKGVQSRNMKLTAAECVVIAPRGGQSQWVQL